MGTQSGVSKGRNGVQELVSILLKAGRRAGCPHEAQTRGNVKRPSALSWRHLCVGKKCTLVMSPPGLASRKTPEGE